MFIIQFCSTSAKFDHINSSHHQRSVVPCEGAVPCAGVVPCEGVVPSMALYHQSSSVQITATHQTQSATTTASHGFSTVQLHTCVMPSVACITMPICKLQPGCNLVYLFPWTLGRKLKITKIPKSQYWINSQKLQNQVTELHKINALLYVATQPSQSKNMYEVNMTKERNDPQGVVDMTYGSTKNLQNQYKTDLYKNTLIKNDLWWLLIIFKHNILNLHRGASKHWSK